MLAGIAMSSCSNSQGDMEESGKHTLLVLAPGHFHASLVHKTMYPQVDSTVFVYAPDGMELEDYLARVRSYNERETDPTHWNLVVYRGDDFLERMLDEQPGDVVVLAGNNRNKTEYIHACVEKGIHVLSDKPMAIEPADYALLKDAFRIAEEKDVLIYDIMTERFEITSILQKRLSQSEAVFGGLVKGTQEEPAITKESVHHFYKYVSGKPLQRPAWFFDATQQGTALADVGTHLVDLVMWEAYPDSSDALMQTIRILSSESWPTLLSKQQFMDVTGMAAYPEYLGSYLSGDTLRANANSAIDFTLFGTHARVTVEWAFRAPEGGGDTHYSIMRGRLANLVIRQGAEQGYIPQLYAEVAEGGDEETLEEELMKCLMGDLSEEFPGLSAEKAGPGRWQLQIPDRYRIGHEAHFGQVTNNFLKYLDEGTLPKWEAPQMLAKYWVTTGAATSD
jgi:predicted dehydrogenase